MQTRLLFVLFILVTALTGCTSEHTAAPMCRVDSDLNENISSNAGCIIRLQDKLVTVTHAMSGKLDIPGGTAEADEPAACTAHRETWEETGFNVEVKRYLGSNDSGFRYYACELSGNFVGEITEFPVPDWSETEVDAIQLIDPYDITEQQWRFNNRLVPLRDMFNQVH